MMENCIGDLRQKYGAPNTIQVFDGTKWVDQKYPDTFTKESLDVAILAEREACAKICDERSEEMKLRAEGNMLTNLGKTVALEKAKTLNMCAAAIRARSDK